MKIPDTFEAWIQEIESFYNSFSTSGWLGLFVFFLINLLIVFFIIISLPEDYLKEERPQFSGLSIPMKIIKNLFGYSLIAIGIILLVLPGQGLLTILCGVLLCDFPGKKDIERRLLMQKGVVRGINKIRKLAGKSSLKE